MYDIIELNNKLVGELKEIAKNLNVPKYEALKKQELIYKILDHQAINPPPAANDNKPENKSENKPEHRTENRESRENRADHKPHENRILRPRKPRPENDSERPKLKQE